MLRHLFSTSVLSILLLVLLSSTLIAQEAESEETEEQSEIAAASSSLSTQEPQPEEEETEEEEVYFVLKVIEIRGLDQVIADEVLDAMTLKIGDEVTYSLQQENRRIIEGLGYFQLVSMKREILPDNSVKLIIDLEENPPYQGIAFEGNTVFPTSELEALITLENGKVINANRLGEDIGKIQTLYYDKGYRAAIVQSALIYEGEERGKVNVWIAEGVIDEVKIEGFRKTKERIIRREIKNVKPGKILHLDDVQKDFNNILNTGLFENLNLRIEPSIKEDFINPVFIVDEAKTGELLFGVGYSTVNKLQGTISVRDRNLFGEAKTVGLSVTFGRLNPGFQIDYADPNIHDSGYSFSARYFNLNYRQQRNPGATNMSEIDVQSVGGALSIGKRLTDKISSSIAVNVTDYSFDVVSGNPFFGLDPRRQAQFQQEGQTRSIILSGIYDSRDNIFNTTDGRFANISTQVTGFGGDFDFRKYQLDLRQFHPITKRVTLGFREATGFGDGQIPFFEQFRIGGANSVRGFPEDFLYGTRYFLVNSEFRFPLSKKETFEGALFLDSGFAGTNYSEMASAIGAGFGVRFRIPKLFGISAIRLDMGWDLESGKSRVHFGLGQMF